MFYRVERGNFKFQKLTKKSSAENTSTTRELVDYFRILFFSRSFFLRRVISRYALLGPDSNFTDNYPLISYLVFVVP